ncbi:hypothetical protein EMA8858_01201 [Emticicia aquatica]|uniref:Peptidase M12B domain-containing protein n=1 Tax=Emticicia aquatica TaxID=1681835 RepID=A0ABM9AMP4_9BACT|nr:M12 family metallo-peptidase [Emticicia aquatica]CAH0995081.1 hypothetical protein EMA8858_01201 [Emticicia aquatica]
MNKYFFTCLLLIVTLRISAQKTVFNQINSFKSQINATFFSPFNITTSLTNVSNSFSVNNTSLQLNANAADLRQIESTKPALLNLSVPFSFTNNFDLELIQIDIFGNNFKVVNGSNQEILVERGIYYKGIIKGDKESLVSISIANGEICGIISNKYGNYILGKLRDSNNYILYNDKDLIEKPSFECGVKDEDLKMMLNNEVQSTLLNNVACRAVQIYFEADNAIYLANSSNITSTTNFVNALFAQVAVLYANEGIEIQISQLKIWDIVDPYNSTTTTSAMLNAFSTQVGNTFTGDLAHLISGRSLGGGVAYLDVLCNKGKGISANIGNKVYNVPTFSWEVEVVSHEMGHNFGSPHTQSCSWIGGPIDNCVSPEGSCSSGPTPVNGGTIMSYCHLTSYGINFSNGFGILPGNLIRNRTQNCMGNAVAPTNLSVLEVYNSSVILVWESFAGPYTIEYRPTTSSTWETITSNSNSVQLTGLTQNTAYIWRVKANCSPYVTSNFSTNSTPAIVYCTINHTTGCNNYAIGLNDVIIGGVNYNPSSGCASDGGYSFRFNTVRTLIIGNSYSITLNPLWIGGNDIQAAIWIDYNKNGIFETTEKVFTTSTATSAPITGSFTVPLDSPTKTQTRMRVVSNFFSAPTNPCGSYTYGETEEFLVDIICQSNPSVPVTVGASRCGTGTLTLSASGCAGTYNWYASLNSGSSLGTSSTFTTPTLSNTNNYYVDCTINSCVSTRALAIATVNLIPNAPSVGSVSKLPGQTATLTATSCVGTVKWYSSNTGTTILATGLSFTTPPLVITTSYFADCSINSCTSNTRAIATVTINNCPLILTLASAGDDISSGNITKIASATTSVYPTANITATNKITGIGTRATFQAKSIELKAGFKADNGTIFKAEIGGCN